MSSSFSVCIGTLIYSAMSDDGMDFSFSVFYEPKEYTVYVKRRPHVDTFLKKVAEMFEIVIFTASLSSYENHLLDKLDPDS
jgi:CTD small phosphatase-like protein 2